MNLGDAYVIAWALAEEYQKREQARMDDLSAKNFVWRVGCLVLRVKNQILEYLDDIQLSEINGDINGAFNNWVRYDSRDKLLLENINLSLDRIEGKIDAKLKSHLNNILKINLFPLYIVAVGFRSTALAEYKHRFITDNNTKIQYTESIRQMWKRALENWNLIDEIVQEINNNRFSNPEIEVRGNFDDVWFIARYKIDGNWRGEKDTSRYSGEMSSWRT